MVVGSVELGVIFIVWCVFIRTHRNSSVPVNKVIFFLLKLTSENSRTLEQKKATRDFCEEIGRGGGGIVYKGIISDGRVAAIKQIESGYSRRGRIPSRS
ncbi:hypothetical protein NC652_031491 [Populus alba x Populus x berolinensis]|nr:hypothetical protein NC652_031491 [Populus alba x Populus x berolinensis]